MILPVSDTRQLGRLIRAVRKTRRVRMDDIPGVGPVFVREVERGKETAQIGRVLKLLDELGIQLHADIPESAMPQRERLAQPDTAPHPRRASKSRSPQPQSRPRASKP